MKKLLSIAVSSVICIGMCSFSAYAEENDINRSYSNEKEFLNLFVSNDSEFSDGGFIYTEKYKISAELNSGTDYKHDYLIIYGLEDVSEIEEIINTTINNDNFKLAAYPEFHSGKIYSLSCNNIESDNYINVVFFVNDVLTDWLKKDINVLQAWDTYGFDVAPYVYTTITSGDINNDNMITASDASLVIEGYSFLSTGKQIKLNNTLFDYNNDGFIDARDASGILIEYAKLSTIS